MPKRQRPASSGGDWEEHPIAWFSALLRAVDRRNQRLVDEACSNLERLGYFVVPFPSNTNGPDRKEVAR